MSQLGNNNCSWQNYVRMYYTANHEGRCNRHFRVDHAFRTALFKGNTAHVIVLSMFLASRANYPIQCAQSSTSIYVIDGNCRLNDM